MATIKVKRGTRSEVNSAASASGLNQGELYLITDEDVLAVGTSSSTYEEVNSAGLSFRNRIINGNLSNPINQRGAGSITASTGYTYDRWYYDGTNLYQGIEDKNVTNGTYIISWEGSGINAAWKVSTDTTANNGPDATTGFTSVSNGGTFTVNEGTEYSKHLWIKFSLDTALDFSTLDKVMVEEGTVATPFEHRPYGTELSLAQRYYCIEPGDYYTLMLRPDGFRFVPWGFPVAMRATPTIGWSAYQPDGTSTSGSASLTTTTKTFLRTNSATTINGNPYFQNPYASAEL